MTMTEFLGMPNGISLDEYEFIIDKKHRLERQIVRAVNSIYDAEDSLEVLSEDVGSNRYNKYLLKQLIANYLSYSK